VLRRAAGAVASARGSGIGAARASGVEEAEPSRAGRWPATSGESEAGRARAGVVQGRAEQRWAKGVRGWVERWSAALGPVGRRPVEAE
jgi:hypothetical protein